MFCETDTLISISRSQRNRGVTWGIGRRRARGEEVDLNLGPGTSHFWGRNVVLDEVVECI